MKIIINKRNINLISQHTRLEEAHISTTLADNRNAREFDKPNAGHNMIPLILNKYVYCVLFIICSQYRTFKKLQNLVCLKLFTTKRQSFTQKFRTFFLTYNTSGIFLANLESQILYIFFPVYNITIDIW